ncbi:hypothetical protein T07_15247 [Trichinella nelsoni]|uniref:Uncharacterized protein n=1 Tax=Trichinella nelsoni TaxID=6336 RepID=A0A0V0SFZ9_9BILA|nr:hypothetical protein T07_15247 [Trichinella nelsoni]
MLLTLLHIFKNEKICDYFATAPGFFFKIEYFEHPSDLKIITQCEWLFTELMTLCGKLCSYYYTLNLK